MTRALVPWLHRRQEDLMTDTERLLSTTKDEANRVLEEPKK
jgi:hypothetical protein